MNVTASFIDGLAPLVWFVVAVLVAILIDEWGARPKKTFASKKPKIQLTKLEVEPTQLNRN